MSTQFSPTDRKKIHELLPHESTNPISHDLIDRIIQIAEIIEIDKEQPLIAEGECNKDIYIILDGIMRVWHWDGDVEKTDYFGMAGTICVSYHSYLLNQPCPNTLEACCHTRLMKISKADYVNLLKTTHEFALYIIGNLQMQSYFYEMMYNTIKGPAYDRYISICKHRPEIIQQVPLKTIASYLGVTPTYLSRLRKKSVYDDSI